MTLEKIENLSDPLGKPRPDFALVGKEASGFLQDRTQNRRPNMNPSRVPKSETPRKSRTRPDGRRTFTPGVDRLEQRISLSGLSPTVGSGHVVACGREINHNETLDRAPRRGRR
jgi:hypothetical protein